MKQRSFWFLPIKVCKSFRIAPIVRNRLKMFSTSQMISQPPNRFKCNLMVQNHTILSQFVQYGFKSFEIVLKFVLLLSIPPGSFLILPNCLTLFHIVQCPSKGSFKSFLIFSYCFKLFKESSHSTVQNCLTLF